MIRKSHKNIARIKAFFAFLICVTFFLFYTTSLFHNHINLRRATDGGGVGSASQMQTIVKDNNQVNVENEESILYKTIQISQYKLFGSKLIFACLYLFIFISLYILSQYFDGWLIIASQSRCKLVVVDYIQQIDGKK